jgi:sugar phosphate permease
VLGLLTVVYALNFLDRTIFNVLIEPIKKEFLLSDTTMGLLAGFGFVLFYSLLGIPIARVADRINRRNIVALAHSRGYQAGDLNAPQISGPVYFSSCAQASAP